MVKVCQFHDSVYQYAYMYCLQLFKKMNHSEPKRILLSKGSAGCTQLGEITESHLG